MKNIEHTQTNNSLRLVKDSKEVTCVISFMLKSLQLYLEEYKDGWYNEIKGGKNMSNTMKLTIYETLILDI